MEESKQKYYRVRHISEIFGIGQSTVYKWVENGKLPKHHAKLSPKCTVWLASDVDKAFDNLVSNQAKENDVVNFSEVV
tara:strand:- start:395 stop:628 length:234 start_codon:yes stop_codon:yes gene_type:complete